MNIIELDKIIRSHGGSLPCGHGVARVWERNTIGQCSSRCLCSDGVLPIHSMSVAIGAFGVSPFVKSIILAGTETRCFLLTLAFLRSSDETVEKVTHSLELSAIIAHNVRNVQHTGFLALPHPLLCPPARTQFLFRSPSSSLRLRDDSAPSSFWERTTVESCKLVSAF